MLTDGRVAAVGRDRQERPRGDKGVGTAVVRVMLLREQGAAMRSEERPRNPSGVTARRLRMLSCSPCAAGRRFNRRGIACGLSDYFAGDVRDWFPTDAANH